MYCKLVFKEQLTSMQCELPEAVECGESTKTSFEELEVSPNPITACILTV